MPLFSRSLENPILLPNREQPWESEAAFNGSTVFTKGKTHILYRAVSSPRAIDGTMLEVSSIGHAVSSDGVHFRERRLFICPEYEWEKYGCEDPRVSRVGGMFYIFYTALSTYPFSAEGIKVAVALTRDLKTIKAKHLVTPFNAKAMALFPEKIGGKITAVLTAHTDKPPAKIAVATFEREEDIWSREYWDAWHSELDKHALPLQRNPRDHTEVGAPPLKTKYGWLLLYSYIKDYFDGSRRVFGVEAALLDSKDPRKILARTYKALFVPEEEYEEFGRVPKIIFPSGALIRAGNLRLYYGAADTTTCLATAKLARVLEKFLHQLQGVRFERYVGNPIISPIPEHTWESKATFNPAALEHQGKICLLYRAMGVNNASVLGYAESTNGFDIDKRLPEPVYTPRADFETKRGGAGNSGCEDPRLVEIDGMIYMCYTAFNGIDPPRVALATIAARDFFAKRWTWSKPVLISPPNIDDKDASLFPRKIRGMWHIIHRIGSSILLDAVERLDALGKENRWLDGEVILQPRLDSWDSKKIGLAGPPIETEDGWLLIYHGVSDSSGKYRIGAALLDLKNPSKVIGRTAEPILEPEMEYERIGQVPNVVFPCGAVVRGNRLVAYYGGADMVIGAAGIDLPGLVRLLAKRQKRRNVKNA